MQDARCAPDKRFKEPSGAVETREEKIVHGGFIIVGSPFRRSASAIRGWIGDSEQRQEQEQGQPAAPNPGSTESTVCRLLQTQTDATRIRIGIQTQMNSEARTGAPSVRKPLGLMGETSIERNGKNSRSESFGPVTRWERCAGTHLCSRLTKVDARHRARVLRRRRVAGRVHGVGADRTCRLKPMLGGSAPPNASPFRPTIV